MIKSSPDGCKNMREFNFVRYLEIQKIIAGVYSTRYTEYTVIVHYPPSEDLEWEEYDI